MPAIPAEEPLRKVTLNLFESDCVAAELIYGHGWTTKLRELWHKHFIEMRQNGDFPEPGTNMKLGDYE